MNIRYFLQKLLTFKACLIFVIFGLLFSCRNNPTAPKESADGLEITAGSFSTFPSATIQLTAIAMLVDGTTVDVTKGTVWSVSPGTAGIIKPDGLFFAHETGVETVRGDYQGQTATLQIEVRPLAAVFAISPTIANVSPDSPIQFRAFATLQSGMEVFVTEHISWSVSPGVAAEINSNGVLHALPGESGKETIIANFQTSQAESEVEVQLEYQNRFEMVRIPSGSFIMGDNNGLLDQQPEHEVYIDAFEIGKFETTNSQYVKYLNETFARKQINYENGLIYRIKPPHRLVQLTRITNLPNVEEDFIIFFDGVFRVVDGFESYPVTRLSWYGAKDFCAFYGLRLPTEAEWEKAGRGGQQLIYGTEDGSISHNLANYLGTGGRDIYEGLAPIGMFPPNPYGISDMCGNAAEAVHDVYDPNYYQNSPFANPKGPGPPQELFIAPPLITANVFRGGAWFSEESRLRSSYRDLKVIHKDDLTATGSLEDVNMGFRVAYSLP